MDATGFFGKAVAHIVAVGLDLPTHLYQGRPKLCGRHRRRTLLRAADTRRHYRLLDRSLTAFGAGDLTRLLLRLESVPVTKPSFELVAFSTSQREQDHRANLLAGSCTPAGPDCLTLWRQR